MTIRIDKFLYYTRFYKTRGLAAKAVNGGHVKVNGKRARVATNVGSGDRVALTKNELPWEFDVSALPKRRGPASEAQACYVEIEETAAKRQQLIDMRKLDRLQMPRTDGRPDKRTRQKLRERRYRD